MSKKLSTEIQRQKHSHPPQNSLKQNENSKYVCSEFLPGKHIPQTQKTNRTENHNPFIFAFIKKRDFHYMSIRKMDIMHIFIFLCMMNGNLHGMHFKRDHSKIELNNCLQKHQMQPHFNDHKIQLIFIIFEYSSLSMLLLQKFSSVFLFYKIN